MKKNKIAIVTGCSGSIGVFNNRFSKKEKNLLWLV